MKTLTLDWLKHNLACENGIKFAVRNNLIGFPFKLLPAVEGDYCNFVEWIDNNQHNITTFDKNGNLISLTRPSDLYELVIEYDDNNNIIHRTITSMHQCNDFWYEYDKDNNCICDMMGLHKTVIRTYEYGVHTVTKRGCQYINL